MSYKLVLIGVWVALIYFPVAIGKGVANPQSKLNINSISQSTNPNQTLLDSTQARINQLDQQIKDLSATVQQQNSTIRSLQSQVTNLQAQKAQTTDNAKKAELDKQISAFQTQINALTSDNQTKSLQLQSLINKRNQETEILSNLIKKTQDTQKSIINNMR